jgi:release factor glutamine methyltransferase
LGYRVAAIISAASESKKPKMTLSIATAILEAAQFLRKAGVTEARREAGSLLAHVINKDRTFLISHAEDLLEQPDAERFRDVVRRRAAGEPLQYITGRQDFYGREFVVSPAVLIPRPETELLVESALGLMNEDATICDVGTGSGCIAITLLCERPNTQAVALDISEPALTIAKQNAEAFGVSDRLVFVRSNCFESLPVETKPFDMIVSNPPYVSADVIPDLQREVKDHEPMVALSPGPDGLSIISRLLIEAPQFLRKDGFMLLEIGFDQSDAVRKIVDAQIWELLEIKPDLQGIPRIVVLRKKNG